AEWIDPVSGALDVPGHGRILPFLPMAAASSGTCTIRSTPEPSAQGPVPTSTPCSASGRQYSRCAR
ncbi:hypothetical protein AB0G02_25555, partial [Actinosynnema sp. NPDC023658]|uniref:hypothetical protein n=1 Tax=Actinosynnema sp. NPDC023658 TaxID=3155465 RepID=UPI0033FD7D26